MEGFKCFYFHFLFLRASVSVGKLFTLQLCHNCRSLQGLGMYWAVLIDSRSSRDNETKDKTAKHIHLFVLHPVYLLHSLLKCEVAMCVCTCVCVCVIPDSVCRAEMFVLYQFWKQPHDLIPAHKWGAKSARRDGQSTATKQQTKSVLEISRKRPVISARTRHLRGIWCANCVLAQCHHRCDNLPLAGEETAWTWRLHGHKTNKAIQI